MISSEISPELFQSSPEIQGYLWKGIPWGILSEFVLRFPRDSSRNFSRSSFMDFFQDSFRNSSKDHPGFPSGIFSGIPPEGILTLGISSGIIHEFLQKLQIRYFHDYFSIASRSFTYILFFSEILLMNSSGVPTGFHPIYLVGFVPRFSQGFSQILSEIIHWDTLNTLRLNNIHHESLLDII